MIFIRTNMLNTILLFPLFAVVIVAFMPSLALFKLYVRYYKYLHPYFYFVCYCKIHVALVRSPFSTVPHIIVSTWRIFENDVCFNVSFIVIFIYWCIFWWICHYRLHSTKCNIPITDICCQLVLRLSQYYSFVSSRHIFKDLFKNTLNIILS